MMQALRHPWLLLVLTLGCGAEKEETTDTTTDPATTVEPTTVEQTTAEPTTLEPSTAAETTEAATTTTDATTGEAPACETSPDDCGVTVSDVNSFCPDTPPAKDELLLEPLGPGKLRITEVGRDAACNIKLGTNVKFYDRLIIVTYEVMGQPNDSCTCKFEVTTTLSGLASGNWEVLVGSWSGKVDVP